VASGLSLRSFSLPSHSNLAICQRLLLWFAAIVLDYAVDPALYNGSPLWAIGTLLVLVFRRGQASDADLRPLNLGKLSVSRVATFVALNAAIIALGRISSAELISAAASDSPGAAALAAIKLFILVPGVVLFSRSGWLALLRAYRAESLAGVVVLFTFFPYRLFHMIWPKYSQVIASLAYYAAKPFVVGLALTNQPVPIIWGPRLNLSIVFACSGFSALALFDSLVALVALLDWNDLNHTRMLVAYILGAAAILVANVVRVSLLVIVGNVISPQYAVGRFHVNAGWVFFALVYLLILSISYRWMLRDIVRRDNS